MTQGFQPDPIKEHAWLTEIAVEITDWRNTEGRAANAVKLAIADGVRSSVIAEHVGWSRATLYRWLAAHPAPAKQPVQSRTKRSRNRAG